MKVASILFFLVFFRISVYNPNLSFSYIIGGISLVLLTFDNYRRFFFSSLGWPYILLSIFVFSYSLVLDIYSGVIVTNPNVAFSIRWLTMLVGSVLPASFIIYFCRIDHQNKIEKIVLIIALSQLVFWFLSYLSPGLKNAFYSFMGATGSPNLKEWNMTVRGFGLSTEINYMSPFLLSFLVLYYLKGFFLKAITLLTQLVNSNMVVLGALVSFYFSRSRVIIKIFMVLLAFIAILFLGELAFPRLYAEFMSGGGTRTAKILIEEHLVMTEPSLLGQIFGNARYVFHGADKFRSDVGWVIIFNVGGLVLCSLFFMFVLNLSFRAFGIGRLFFIFVLFFLLLNTKGLVLGVNGLMFLLHFYLFFNFFEGRSRTCLKIKYY